MGWPLLERGHVDAGHEEERHLRLVRRDREVVAIDDDETLPE